MSHWVLHVVSVNALVQNINRCMREERVERMVSEPVCEKTHRHNMSTSSAALQGRAGVSMHAHTRVSMHILGCETTHIALLACAAASAPSATASLAVACSTAASKAVAAAPLCFSWAIGAATAGEPGGA